MEVSQGFVRRRRNRQGFPAFSPVQVLVLSFAALILLGAVILMLRPCQSGSVKAGFLDALFTSTSAVCVTGLVTVDTSTAWSGLGQVVILILFQVGGIGIVTFGALFALLLGHRLTFRQRALLKEQYGEVSVVRITSFLSVVKVVALVTVTIETIGAVLLWPVFARETGTWPGAFHAVFHSVSAFCNAGFSTFSNSLESYQAHLGVNLVVSGLIVLGGLGFPVLAELMERLRDRRRLSLHSRVVLRATLWLVAAGFVLIFFLGSVGEGKLSELPLWNRILVSFFQSVTSRTAGFNTIPIGALSPAVLLVLQGLMFVGGSPAGTAGGVKTTTLAAAIAAARSVLEGRSDVVLLDRRLAPMTARRALVLMLLATGLLMAALVILLSAGPGSVLELSFEAVSAFGTVGLSTGITSHLTAAQKMVIILLMFIGRVGPMAFALTFARVRVEHIRLAETDLLTG